MEFYYLIKIKIKNFLFINFIIINLYIKISFKKIILLINKLNT